MVISNMSFLDVWILSWYRSFHLWTDPTAVGFSLDWAKLVPQKLVSHGLSLPLGVAQERSNGSSTFHLTERTLNWDYKPEVFLSQSYVPRRWEKFVLLCPISTLFHLVWFPLERKITTFRKVFLPLLKPRDVRIFRTKSVLVKLKGGSFL